MTVQAVTLALIGNLFLLLALVTPHPELPPRALPPTIAECGSDLECELAADALCAAGFVVWCAP